MSDFPSSQGSPFQNLFIFTAAGVKCRVAALKGLPYSIVLQIIFSDPLEPVGIFSCDFRCCTQENKFCHSNYVLHSTLGTL